jgi:hypothetical protein
VREKLNFGGFMEREKTNQLDTVEKRRQAMIEGMANNALEGYFTSDEDRLVFEKWVAGDLSIEQVLKGFCDECGIEYVE